VPTISFNEPKTPSERSGSIKRSDCKAKVRSQIVVDLRKALFLENLLNQLEDR